MKTLELAKKAVTRIAEVAVTQDQFDKWNSTKKRQWLKDHPTSKFGKNFVRTSDGKTTDYMHKDELKKASNKVSVNDLYRQSANLKKEMLNLAKQITLLAGKDTQESEDKIYKLSERMRELRIRRERLEDKIRKSS